MKTLVIYYSYTGNAKRIANDYARKGAADIAEIKDAQRPGKLKAYTLGCFAAMRGKQWPIQPLEVDRKVYDRFIVFSPVWAGNPPPAVHAMLESIPKGKTVSIKMVSASGHSKCKERLEAVIKARGCKMDGFEDIKA